MKLERTSPVLMATLVLMSAQSLAHASEIPVPTPRPDPGTRSMSYAAPQPRLRPVERGTPLTLAEAVFMGLRGNRSIQSAYIDRVVQKFDLRVAEDRFTPQLGIAGSVARQRFGNVESTEIGASPGVTMLTRTGARFDFGWTNVTSLTQTDRISRSALELNVEQPLLRGAGTEVNLAPVRIAQLGERVNRLRLAATVSETVSRIILAHRTVLLAQEELRLSHAAVDRAQALLDTNRRLIDAGRLPAIDAIQTEADLERQRLRVLTAERNREQARLSLLSLLGLDLAMPIVAVERLVPAYQSTDLQDLLTVAFARRPDFQGQLLVLEQTHQGRVVAQNEQLWDISFFANARRNLDFGDNASTDGSTDLRAGLRFEFPVRDLQRESVLVQADASQQNANVQLAEIRAGVEGQIRNAVSEINILWQQISVAERSVDLARRSVEVELLKLNAGRSSSFAVGVLEDNLRSAESQLLSARVDYLNALTQLDLALGTTLNTWQIDLRG